MTHKEARARRRLIAEAVAAGVSVAQVSSLYEVSLASIYSACKEHGVAAPAPKEIHVDTYVVIADLLNTGDSLMAIGSRRGLSRERVRQIYQRCLDAGVLAPVRKRGRHSPAK